MRRKVLAALGLAGGLVLALPGVASAQEDPTLESVSGGVETLRQQTNLLWIVIGAVLVVCRPASAAT